jgi:hypothetical protein
MQEVERYSDRNSFLFRAVVELQLPILIWKYSSPWQKIESNNLLDEAAFSWTLGADYNNFR